METQPHLSHIISDMAQALCQRRDEPPAKQVVRAQGAARCIVAFQPGDAIEAMIAGHCVMFHELIVDSVQATLRGEADSTRRATRNGIVAMDKAFGANLVRLEKYRARHADNVAPADAHTETEPQTEAAEPIPPPDATHVAPPDGPREAYAAMPGLNRQARRAIGRQSRKRIDPATSPIANANAGRSH